MAPAATHTARHQGFSYIRNDLASVIDSGSPTTVMIVFAFWCVGCTRHASWGNMVSDVSVTEPSRLDETFLGRRKGSYLVATVEQYGSLAVAQHDQIGAR